MQKKLIQKILSAVLRFLFVFALLPVSARADAGDTFEASSSGLKFKVLTEDTTAGTGTVAVINNNYSRSIIYHPGNGCKQRFPYLLK